MKHVILRNPQDMVLSVIFLAMGIGGLVISFGYPMGTLLRMGPGYFPSIIFSGLILVGVIVAIGSLRFDGPGLEAWNCRAVIFLLGSVLVFAFLMRPLGFIAAIVVSVFVSGLAHSPFRPIRILLLGCGLAFASALIFVIALGLPIRLWP